MNSSTLSRCLSFAFCFLVASSSMAQDDKPTAASPSPVGTWNWEWKAGQNTIASSVTILNKNGKLSGVYKDKERKLDIQNPTLKKGELTFFILPNKDDQDYRIQFKGKVAKSSITGKMTYPAKGADKTVDWKAKRAEDFSGIVGKWVLEFATPDGVSLEYNVTVSKKKKGISLKFAEDSSAKISKVLFKDDILTFTSVQDYEGQPISVDWDLTLKGEQLDGVLYYQFTEIPEQNGELEVSGSRSK